MSHMVEISDESYQSLMSLATARGQKPEDLLEQWLREVRTQLAAPPAAEIAGNGETRRYDPTVDPLASFLGAFEATSPDVVRHHDAYVVEG